MRWIALTCQAPAARIRSPIGGPQLRPDAVCSARQARQAQTARSKLRSESSVRVYQVAKNLHYAHHRSMSAVRKSR